MTTKKGDFIELNYTGKIAEDSTIFDTTIEKVAKDNKIFQETASYKPIIICIGKGHVISGLDSNLEGKELERSYTFQIKPEDAFGSKNPKLIRLIASNKFKQQGVNPQPGMQVNIDKAVGTLLRVGSGRAVVDFNHPLAGKELKYEVMIDRIITDINEKVKATLSVLGIDAKSAIAEDKLTLIIKAEIPEQGQDSITKAITETIPEIKSVSYEVETTKPTVSEKTDNKI